MVATIQTLDACSGELTFNDACRLAESAGQPGRTSVVVLDLEQVSFIQTAALARLIKLRRDLLKAGSDLRLTHLAGRTKGLYDLYHLNGALPTQQ